MGNFDAKAVNIFCEGVALAGLADEGEGAEAVEVGEAEIFAGRVREDQALRLAVFGDEADAGFDRMARGAGIVGAIVEKHFASVAAVSAEDEAGEFGAACADEAGEAEN